MATKVKMTYTPRANLSITKRNGRVSKVTQWQSGVPGSTQRIVVPR